MRVRCDRESCKAEFELEEVVRHDSSRADMLVCPRCSWPTWCLIAGTYPHLRTENQYLPTVPKLTTIVVEPDNNPNTVPMCVK